MNKNFNDRPLKIFMSYIHGHKAYFYFDMFCATMVSLIDLVFPYVSRTAMKVLLPEKMYSAFFYVMLFLLLAFILKGGFFYFIAVMGHRMGVLVEYDMRRDVFEHMQSLSCSYYDKHRTGVLMSHITSDLFDVTELAHHGPENILICTITIVGALIMMFIMQWQLALVLTVILPLCLAFVLSQRMRMRTANVEVKRKTAVIYSAIESSISGIRTSKAFANEEQERKKFKKANELFKGSKVEYYNSMGLFSSGMEFTTSIMQVMVVAFGGFLIMKGKMDYIELITFSLYVTTFVSPIRRLTQFSEQYMQGTAGFMRFIEIMRTEPDIKDAPDAQELKSTEGSISFENVSFDYGNGVPVLKDISFNVKPGRSFALVGPSGGGKTTMCQLIPRFYDVSKGCIKIDGRDVRSLTQASLRKNIGIIQQDVFMFAGTIKENIRYGKPDASDEEIIEAAKKAQVHNEIMEMPDGYDSYVGERGVMLSGGQKQRISIARVFLKNPKILIMDEATSALDTVTEQKIQDSLNELSRGRTSIIVAHRLSTIKNADCIAVVEGEHIVEQGSHEELIEKDGVYAELCRAQTLMKGEQENA